MCHRHQHHHPTRHTHEVVRASDLPPGPAKRRASDPALRVSDADRERVADTLRIHAGEGRLDHEELEERLEAVFAARTGGELDAPLKDLPRLRTRRTQPARQGMPKPASFAVLLAVVLTAALITPWAWFGMFLVDWPALTGHHRAV